MTTPWQPQGNVHSLSGFAITQLVPKVSGVYGLHNQHQQLFIGEAADLREALLLHWHESDKLFRGQQPTHFSFEICDAEVRAQRAQSLIASHQPAIQALQLLTLADRTNAKPKRRSILRFNNDAGETLVAPQWPQAQISHDASPPRQYFSRGQLATVLALFMVTAGLAGFLGYVSGQKIRTHRLAAMELARAPRPVLAYMTAEASLASDGDGPVLSRDASGADPKPIATAAQPASEATAQPVQIASAAPTSGEASAAIRKQPTAVAPVSRPQPAAPESKEASVPAVSPEASSNNWSVQVGATQEQKAAQQLLDRLKSKGFDAYIVEADLDSGRWYRLRVGRFATQQEAETNRQALQSKENLRNAFVTAK